MGFIALVLSLSMLSNLLLSFIIYPISSTCLNFYFWVPSDKKHEMFMFNEFSRLSYSIVLL